MGLFAGSRPTDLGFNQGKFKPPSWKPNTVSSTIAKDDKHYIAPIVFKEGALEAWGKLVTIVKSQPRISVVNERADYLYAESASAGLGFIDDVEFALDATAKVIHVRSGSRLGVRDFDVNRTRIERIRTTFAAR
ncbi:MAG: DUF1499 domain-containing protein [Gammaproteobacteria bacterium]|nr:DUF1499 domain-containing protein [Gammaproteobacteria bacterium]